MSMQLLLNCKSNCNSLPPPLQQTTNDRGVCEQTTVPGCAQTRSESKARVVKILTTQNSSQIISLAYLDDSADLNKSIKMVLTTHRPKQI